MPSTALCPQNFSLGNVRAEKASGLGTCTALDPNTLRQTCTAFDNSNCRIVGDCTAN